MAYLKKLTPKVKDNIKQELNYSFDGSTAQVVEQRTSSPLC
jgi:hypothetical protein